MKDSRGTEAFQDEFSRCAKSRIVSFATASSCLVVGVCGLLGNAVSPGSTVLDALMVVGLFYLLLGIGEGHFRRADQPIAAVDRKSYSDSERFCCVAIDRIDANG